MSPPIDEDVIEGMGGASNALTSEVKFDAIDTDGDGFITASELKASLGGRMWRHGAKIVGGIAAVIAAVGINAGPASASSRLYIGGFGYGEFQSYGDHWYACDIHTDGYGVRVDWNVPATGRTGNVSDTSGNDGACGHSNENIGEGREVHYRVCLVNNGVAVSCTGYIRDFA